MGDIHFIVDRLNEPPFSMPLSLVAFDEKSPFELLEIVNAVIREISAEHAANLRDETPEATATRMMDFLFKVLNYQQSLEPEHFKTGLLHGDPGILYPALGWMLERRSELTTRAYLARFLLNVEIPEHMFGDDEILELYQQHKDLQEQFKEAHKASEQSRSQLISPAEIKKAIVQMEEDKEQLERKVEALHTKLHGSDGFEPMLREVGALRVEQDEQLKLAERMKEQRSHAYQAEQRLEQLSRALAGKKAEAGVSDLGRLLQKLEAEVAAMSRRAHEELPRAIVQRQQRHDELQQVLSLPAGSESDTREMLQHRQGLQRAIRELEV